MSTHADLKFETGELRKEKLRWNPVCSEHVYI